MSKFCFMCDEASFSTFNRSLPRDTRHRDIYGCLARGPHGHTVIVFFGSAQKVRDYWGGFCGTSDQGAGPLNTGPVCNVVIEHFDEHKRQDLRYVPVAFDIEHGIAFAIDVSEDIQ